MSTILNVTIPFFAVIGCGYLSGRLGILGHASRAGLNGFVFYFALPALVFSIMSNARFDAGFEWRFLAARAGTMITLGENVKDAAKSSQETNAETGREQAPAPISAFL